MRCVVPLVAVVAAGLVAGQSTRPVTPMGTITRLDPRFDKLIPPGAVIEKLAVGFHWAEGPVWDKANNCLLFSDVPKNTVFKWEEAKGLAMHFRPSGFTGSKPFTGREPGSNGLTFDADSQLILCQHGDRRVARRTADGKFTTLADRYGPKRFNSPNDIVLKSDGDLYFTDPPYGLPKTFKDPGRELDFCGVYRLSKDGDVFLLTKSMSAPNGLAFSPDERTLYVANSDAERPVWMAFPVDDRELGTGKVFFDATELMKDRKGVPDGLKVDREGNLFATGPGGVCVFAPDGTHLGTLETGVATANCAWGDDGSVLYITADKNLARVRTATRGW